MVDRVLNRHSGVSRRRVDVEASPGAFRALGFSSLPTSMLVAADGELLGVEVGGLPEARLDEWLRGHRL